MTDWIEIKKDEKQIAREKVKAKELRKSNWWKQKLASGICHYCGKKFKPEELTMDHIVPIVRGGKSTKSNVVPACKECNNKKKYLTPVEILMNREDSLTQEK
ncbi:MAG: HNH endonuclease [Candidatus Marinimicrobia bacterium]|jgi:5-methylcytosine-specific restriction endonuclease McrA|nr:HNH endonuclease [Candidatus Neomarinimicrobiota bacterium]MCK9559975.1 HNH endonuclease [Candidatus Neomarinimicrobiota bacterium]